MSRKSRKSWWIKERYNPQVGTYFVALGQIASSEAVKQSASLYGHNKMHSFETEDAYLARLDELRKAGEHVQPDVNA